MPGSSRALAGAPPTGATLVAATLSVLLASLITPSAVLRLSDSDTLELATAAGANTSRLELAVTAASLPCTEDKAEPAETLVPLSDRLLVAVLATAEARWLLPDTLSALSWMVASAATSMAKVPLTLLVSAAPSVTPCTFDSAWSASTEPPALLAVEAVWVVPWTISFAVTARVFEAELPVTEPLDVLSFTDSVEPVTWAV